ncbi:sodium/pantothenate symporter [Streptomonospora halophila]|uniref:Sodium/pantothenate symporter n=1 Tax=Streptomonospora halophila TaxID=427369 RepID=A0ABP9G6L4_9ACTN
MESLTFSGAPGIIVLCAYAALMLGIGFWAGRRRPDKKHTLKSYYLAGGNLGVLVLFFTLYATQYSGNTVIGYAPQAYRAGFPWWQSVTFFMVITAGYMLFAPRLYVLAKRKSFVTPTDWIRHRFGSPAVTLLATLLMLWALANYLLEQLVAMGHAIAGLTGGTVPYQVAVALFVCVMLLYSWTGGMRAVALTDVMQGIALLLGVALLLTGAFYLTGESPAGTTRYLIENDPESVSSPPLEVSVNWISMIVMVGLSICLYPHAIQRIYAAHSERALKRSLRFLVWMPLVTAGAVFCVGMVGIRLFPGLSDGESEQLVGMIANEVGAINTAFYVAMVLLFGGIVAAVVSTADSAFLSLSSIISKDVYGRYVNPRAEEHRQVRLGKTAGIAVVFVLLLLAWNPPTTLVNIFVLKMELLVQLAPSFILGMYWKRLTGTAVFWGMAVGVVIAGGMTWLQIENVYGVHGGIIGLLANVAICVAGSLAARPQAPRTDRPEAEHPRQLHEE